LALLVCPVGMAVRWAAIDRASFAARELSSHAPPHLALGSYSTFTSSF